ncbi:MAG: DsbA family protein [Caldilineales bacterium]|nr:DsbA family protein [Caldilineales bacterium]MCW5860691.1 thioredoxin domain-containing protein [Caldilineales bacterium]
MSKQSNKTTGKSPSQPKPAQPAAPSSAPTSAPSAAASRRTARQQREAQRQRNRTIAYGVIAAGVILVIALIFWVNRPQPLDLKDVSTENPPNANGLAWGGPEGAKVVIKEYSDFQCPFCGRHAVNTMPLLIERYANNPNVRYEFHPYAFIGQESTDAAAAALCASDQNKFWPFHDTVFANQNGENLGAFSKANLKTIAQAVGLDMAQFNQCFDGGEKLQEVNRYKTEATQLGVQSTPTFYINGQEVKGAQPATSFNAIIDQALAGS